MTFFTECMFLVESLFPHLIFSMGVRYTPLIVGLLPSFFPPFRPRYQDFSSD